MVMTVLMAVVALLLILPEAVLDHQRRMSHESDGQNWQTQSLWEVVVAVVLRSNKKNLILLLLLMLLIRKMYYQI